MKIIQTPAVQDKFNNYPAVAQEKLRFLRQLVIDTATEIDSISSLEETLKWGEPSYLVKKGSTIRMDWKAKLPEQYALYFKCTSQLVPTFKKIYGNTFRYEKNRAIIFKLDESLPVKELKQCIKLALTYHRIKHLPDLGREVKYNR